MKKKNWSNWILIAVFCFGLCLLLYPTAANWWNSKVSSKAISKYDETVTGLTQEDFDAEFKIASEYNEALCAISAPLINYEQLDGYESALNVDGSGMMGYIEIPKIDVHLPIYHGVSEIVLSSAVGHLPGTSLPVGGMGTHSVLSAHRGLPSAQLFTYLDKLQQGDIFTITILNRLFTYEVDQIRIVSPDETDDLRIVEGQDYVTLLTCTPYGLNTDRLLVRGHRIDNIDPSEVVLKNEAYELDNLILAPLIAAPVLIVLFVLLLTGGRKPKRKNDLLERIKKD